MDQILSQLESTVLNSENDQTNFDGLYKNWGKFSNQEQRRKNILNVQKRNRNNKMDTSRGIMDIVSSVERYNDRPYGGYRPSIHVAGFTPVSLSYKNVLMLSEWLIEKPEDFNTNWYVVPCPKGIRTLVVAYQGITKFYTKHGDFRMSSYTALPGGNPYKATNKNQCVVLDCFHVKCLNKMFILDVLAWKSQPMADGETEFRHYWVKTQIEETAKLTTVNSKNKILFEMLPKVPCDTKSFNEFMMKAPHFENGIPILDGLLFYHKRAHYISGETPLVGWLFPYMVNEVLGAEITVNQIYLDEKPKDYIDQADFIQKFELRMRKKRPLPPLNDSMDTSSELEQPQQEQKACTDSENTETIVMEEVQEVLLATEMSTNDLPLTPIQAAEGS